MSATRDDAAGRFGRRFALATMVAVGVLLGGASGTGFATLLGVAGALALAWSVRAVTGPAARAVRSVVLTVGLVAVGGALWFTTLAGASGATVCLAVTVAVLALGLDGRSDRAATQAATVVRETGAVVVAVALLATVAHLDGVAALVGTGGWVVENGMATALGGLIAVELAVAVLLAVLPQAVAVLEGWGVGDDRLPSRDLRPAALADVTLPAWYWVLVGIGAQALVALTAPGLLDAVLARLSLLGGAVGFALRSGLLLAPVVLAIGLCLLVFLARGLQRAVLVLTDTRPADTVANVSGGLLVVTVGGAVLAGIDGVPTSGIGAWVTVSGPVGAVAVTLAFLAGMAAVGRRLAGVIGESRALPEDAPGLAVGVGLLLLATVVAAESGASALLVFVGVAAALLAWDVGEYGTTLRRQLPGTTTREVELAHATAGVLVAAVGVALATVAAYVVGPLRAADGSAALALVGALVALVAFLLVARGSGTAE